MDDELGTRSVDPAIGEGQCLGLGPPHVDAGMSHARRRDERFGRVDRAHRCGSKSCHELGGEGSRTAPYIEYALARTDFRQIRELWRERARPRAHEPVVGLRRDVEDHVANLRPGPVAILPPVRLLPARITEAVAPSRLGSNFRWLLGSTVVNNIGDGVAISAGPLLVASQTRDPLLVSMALLSEFLPALLFGVVAGTAADRFDRRRMVAAVNVGRAFVLAALVATIVTGNVNIVAVLVALFVLGTAETFADAASSALLPGLVAREDLGVANSRLQGAFVLANGLLLPPVGAFMFAVGMALPFATNAACFALGALLISRVATSTMERSGEGTGFRAEMVEGVRWLVAHPPMRTLALTILTFNVTYGAAWSVLVLYAGERLGMNEVGFGLLTTAAAVGGVIGIASYGSLERRFSLANIMRVGLLIETATHLVLALTTSAAVALVTLVVFGAHAFVWGTTSTVVRQSAVPDELLGRVGGVYRVAIMGGLVIGTPLGGLIARTYGITAPFWFGFIGSAILVAILWRQFDHIVHAGDAPTD
jgi:MFS family permease